MQEVDSLDEFDDLDEEQDSSLVHHKPLAEFQDSSVQSPAVNIPSFHHKPIDIVNNGEDISAPYNAMNINLTHHKSTYIAANGENSSSKENTEKNHITNTYPDLNPPGFPLSPYNPIPEVRYNANPAAMVTQVARQPPGDLHAHHLQEKMQQISQQVSFIPRDASRSYTPSGGGTEEDVTRAVAKQHDSTVQPSRDNLSLNVTPEEALAFKAQTETTPATAGNFVPNGENNATTVPMVTTPATTQHAPATTQHAPATTQHAPATTQYGIATTQQQFPTHHGNNNVTVVELQQQQELHYKYSQPEEVTLFSF